MSNHNDKVTFRVRVVAYIEIDGIPPTEAQREAERANGAYGSIIMPSDPTRIIGKYNDLVMTKCRNGGPYPKVMMTGGGRHREMRSRHDVEEVRKMLTTLGAVEIGDPEEAP